MSDVLLSCWVFKLNALADTVCLLYLWTRPCVVQASEHILLQSRYFPFMSVCVDLGGKKLLSVQLFLAVGVWNLHLCRILRKCTGGCGSLRKEGRKCNTGPTIDRFI